MVYYMFSFALVAIEVWCVLYFLDTFLKKKDIGNLEKYRFTIYFVAMVIPAALSSMMSFAKIFVFMIWFVVLGMLFYKASVIQTLFFSGLWYGIMLCVDWFAMSVEEYFVNSTTSREGAVNYLLAIGAKLTEVIIMLIIRKIWKSPNEYVVLKKREWWFLMSVPVFSIVAIVVMYIFYPDDTSVQSVYLFLAVGLAGMDFLVIYFLQNILDKSEQLRVSTLANQNAKNQIEAYHDMDAVYEWQRRKMHDYKNQIVTVQNLVQGGNIDKAMSLMEQLTESIFVDLSAINTNHPVVNAVLNQKILTAKEKQVSMIFQLGDVHEIQITEEEIVILLCNLLDNAINECEKVVKAGRDAVIQFKLVYEDGKVILSIKNPVHHKIEIIDNMVRSNCENGHGIGLKNVELVVEKYDGSIAFDCDDNEFKAVVIL